MKPTGIVRRIDDLGRIVIPKEIRRSMRINDGDPLEIFTSAKGITLCKYDPIGQETWEIVKNVLRHLLPYFKLENSNHQEQCVEGKRYAVYNETPITDNDGYVLGYLCTHVFDYSEDQINTAVKIAKEILNNI